MNILFTYFFTALIPLVCGINSLKNSISQETSFFSKEYTDVFKGLCCLVVIYVHVRPERGNALQDVIGSFAYVCVTFFFIVSAYGMMSGVDRKQNYLKNFWRNRLVSLLIPCFLINIVGYVLGLIGNDNVNLSMLYVINGYVIVLLQWCSWFYVIQICKHNFFPKNDIFTDFLLIVGVVLSSLYLYFFVKADVSAEQGWCYERIGLVWGIVLYRIHGKFVNWMDQSRLFKGFLLMLLGLVLGIGYLKYKVVYFWGGFLLKVLLAFVLLLLLFITTSKRRFGDVISNWLGAISYEVYLSHGMVMGFMTLMLPSELNSGVFIIIAVIVIMLLSTGVHSIVRPIVKLLRAK